MEPALFEVTGHFAVRGRGVVVSGHPRSGTFRAGMRVHTGDDPPALTVSGWEIGHTVERRAIYSIAFRDAPSLEFVKKVFPVGSVLHIEEAQAQPMQDRDQIEELTALMRTSEEPPWPGLRQGLLTQGVNPATSILVEFFDDGGEDFGIVISRARRAIEFALRQPRRRGEPETIVRWKDITDDPSSNYAELAEAGLDRLDE